jgi:AcrR family transcriptional regulator
LSTPVVTDADAPNQRSRILDAALGLVSELGAAGTSMRRLASACGLNVATIYHYFPSKADLLRALIEERRYGERMASDEPPMDPALAPRARLAALVAWVAERTLEEEATVLRLIVGEGLRGDPTAQMSATELVGALDEVAARWVAAGFPELAGASVSPDVVGRLVRVTLLAIVTEQLATGSTDIPARAHDLAAVVFGHG